MKKYFLTSSGQIISGPEELPINYKNISNFHTLSEEQLAEHGFLPAVISRPEFDARIRKYAPPTITLNNDHGTVDYAVVDYPLDECKTRLVQILKTATREHILAHYPIYTQNNASLGILSAEETTAIRAGIATHRTACNTVEAIILAATTAEESVMALDAYVVTLG